MKSLSIVGLGLGVAFGCLLILLVAEVCYFLCWKKRTSRTDSEKDSSNIAGKDLFQMFCEERSSFNGDDDPEGQVHQTQACRFYSQRSPRFLFTIEEGIKEGSESESVNKSSCRVSPCDSFINVETPYFTPLASSSPCLTSPLALPLSMNPHFEAAYEHSAEFNRAKSSTPPTRFKLLHHKEEKPNYGQHNAQGSHQVKSREGQMHAVLSSQAEGPISRFEPMTLRSHDSSLNLVFEDHPLEEKPS